MIILKEWSPWFKQIVSVHMSPLVTSCVSVFRYMYSVSQKMGFDSDGHNTMMATNYDHDSHKPWWATWWNLSNDISMSFGFNDSRFHCCGHHGHGLWPSWYRRGPQKIPPQVFWHFPPNGWEFLLQILHAHYTFIYVKLQIFIQLSPTVTKLCHSKCDHPVHIMCSKCPPSAETHTVSVCSASGVCHPSTHWPRQHAQHIVSVCCLCVFYQKNNSSWGTFRSVHRCPPTVRNVCGDEISLPFLSPFPADPSPSCPSSSSPVTSFSSPPVFCLPASLVPTITP